MILKFKKKGTDRIEAGDASGRLTASDSKKAFLLLAIRVLLQFVQDFSLDLKEIRSDEFRKRISDLSAEFAKDKKTKKIQSCFEKNKKVIADFIKRQKDYLIDRENEFKDIIDILSRAMVTLDTENREYNQKILKQSEKIEQITLLDDIKKLKQALIQEIEQIRQTVKEKQSRDSAKLEILSNQVSTLNVQLEKARTESVTDGLTGIYNRKAFDHYLADILEKNTTSGSTFALLMLDIDNFKGINDTHGHQIGDRVLLAIVNKCRQSIRGEDFLARYGGEEFVMVLPGASLENAVKKADQICSTIAATRYFLDDASGSQTLAVTVSIGVIAHRESDTAAGIIERVDKALYAAKDAGKNRVFSEPQ